MPPNTSRSLLTLFLIITILFLLISSTAATPRRRRTATTHRPCNAKFPPAICSHLQKMHRRRPLPLPPSLYEIDPRYGVQKRLVPSGPNPLHN